MAIIIAFSVTNPLYSENSHEKPEEHPQEEKSRIPLTRDVFLQARNNVTVTVDEDNQIPMKSYTKDISVPWQDKVFSLGISAGVDYSFNDSFNIGPGIIGRWWPLEHFQLAAEVSSASRSFLADVSYWSKNKSLGFFAGAGLGTSEVIFSGPFLTLYLTTGLDILFDQLFSLGFKVNAGYLFLPSVGSWKDYNNFYITAAVSANFIVSKNKINEIKSSLAIDTSNAVHSSETNSTKKTANDLSIDGEIARGRIEIMLKNNRGPETVKFRDEVVELSSDDREILYQLYKKDPALPVVLNGLLGYGIGSWIQGDREVATYALIADITATALIAQWAIPQIDYNMHTYLSVGGFLIAIASRIVQIVLPINYSISYNSILRNVLIGKVQFQPLIQLASANPVNSPTYGALLTTRF